MKIIRYDKVPCAPQDTDQSYYTAHATLVADSCARPHMRPLFVPGDPSQWRCSLRVAVRIGRLGKAIARKFAPRYYDEFTLVNILEPADAASMGLTTPTAMLDDSIVTGNWLPISGLEGHVTLKVTDPDGEVTTTDIAVAVDTEFVDSVIATLSRDATFRTGDMIILPQPIIPIAPTPDSHVTAGTGDHSLIDFRIK